MRELSTSAKKSEFIVHLILLIRRQSANVLNVKKNESHAFATLIQTSYTTAWDQRVVAGRLTQLILA